MFWDLAMFNLLNYVCLLWNLSLDIHVLRCCTFMFVNDNDCRFVLSENISRLNFEC